MKDLNLIKGEKLLHYSKRDPKKFIQIDGFTKMDGDNVTPPDNDGDCLFTSETIELMTGNPDVRLLIVPGTNPYHIIRLLSKMVICIFSNPENFGKA